MFKHTLRKEGQRAKQPRGERETFRQGREGWEPERQRRSQNERGGPDSQTDTQLGRTTREPDLHRVTQFPKERKVGEGGEHTSSSHTEQGTRQGRDTGSRREPQTLGAWGETQGAGEKEPEGTAAPERCRGQLEARGPTCQSESAISGGQEGEGEKDTEACVGRGAHVRGRTRTNTHTQSHSLAARDPDVESERPSYELGFGTQSQPEAGRKTWTHRDTHSPSYTETRRERQRQHLLERRPAGEALTPGRPVTSHSQRLREVSRGHREARRWSQSCGDAAPRVAGTCSDPSVRGLRVCWRDPSSRPASHPESDGRGLPESEGSGRIKTSGIRGPLTRLRKMGPGPSAHTHVSTRTEARWREAGLQARCCGAQPEWGGGEGKR